MHSEWFRHELVFRSFPLFHQETIRASLAFGTLLSRFGCILIASSFRKKRPCLTMEASHTKGVAGRIRLTGDVHPTELDHPVRRNVRKT